MESTHHLFTGIWPLMWLMPSISFKTKLPMSAWPDGLVYLMPSKIREMGICIIPAKVVCSICMACHIVKALAMPDKVDNLQRGQLSVQKTLAVTARARKLLHYVILMGPNLLEICKFIILNTVDTNEGLWYASPEVIKTSQGDHSACYVVPKSCMKAWNWLRGICILCQHSDRLCANWKHARFCYCPALTDSAG